MKEKSKIPIPPKFSLVSNCHFILLIPGVDSFLVKSVARPPYIRPKETWNREKPDWQLLDEHLAHKKLIVVLHNAIAPSTEQQVQELVNQIGDIPEVEIRFLDPVGKSIGSRVFYGVKIERVDYDLLTYDNPNSSSEIKLTLSYNNDKLL